MNSSGKRLAVRLTPEYHAKLETLYRRFQITGSSDSSRIRKLLDALSSVAEPELESTSTQSPKMGKVTASVEAERVSNDEFPISVGCPYAGPYREKDQVWVFCDNTELRVKRGTNKVPLSACLQCDTRTRQSKQQQPQREAQALPAPTAISSSPFSNLTFLKSSFSRGRMLIMIERFDLLTPDLRQAIEWGLAHTDQISDIDKLMLDQLREKLRNRKEDSKWSPLDFAK